MLALLGVLMVGAAPRGPQEGEVRAQWRCEPEAVELGAPFELVLELAHPPGMSGRELCDGAPALDESWVVLGQESASSTSAGDGTLRTRRVWRVASLEPGERSLAEALSRVVLSERVTQIRVGAARVSVSPVLAEGEDAPRPLREFPAGFAGTDAPQGGPAWTPWLAFLGLVLAGGAGAYAWRRRRGRRGAARAATPLERLAELERAGGNEGCYELTRLLRAAGDGLRRTRRGGLTDEEWLAEITASLEVPRNAALDLSAVFERAARVKYAGEAPTPWAMQEIFTRARAALEVLGAGAPSAGGTRS